MTELTLKLQDIYHVFNPYVLDRKDFITYLSLDGMWGDELRLEQKIQFQITCQI